MSDRELESFEAELRAMKPASSPPELLARLQNIKPQPCSVGADASARAAWRWRDVLRWFAPATALAVGLVVVLLVALRWHHGPLVAPQQRAKDPSPAAAPEVVEIDRQLVASYDAIAEMSSGMPVRFHCQEWEDKFVFRDRLRGIDIERRAPRLEVVPVSVETY